ncbi:hypothetical protein IWQ60_010032 [Tieghemiomyces parasiticus]|uniref:BHLH domain-containing protein n=1 Tax=Tieghemiomyces parasiticus TaxID=78921 RepID=A0A9W7ZSP7_9FUNG|nr:hypothetical protein IWQ60_010032 [Tieghemiomyces parasiticus]
MNQPSLRLTHPGAFQAHHHQQQQQHQRDLDALSGSLGSSTINPSLLNMHAFAQSLPVKQENSSPDMGMQQDVDIDQQLHALASPISIARPGMNNAHMMRTMGGTNSGSGGGGGDSDSADDLRQNSLNPSSPFAASPAINGALYSPLGDNSTIYEHSEFSPSSYNGAHGLPMGMGATAPGLNRFFRPDQLATSPPVHAFQSMSLPNHTPEWFSGSFDPASFAAAAGQSPFAFHAGGGVPGAVGPHGSGNDPSLVNGLFDQDPDSGEYAKQIVLLNEKRQRRRESHNAVERRRRDNINEKIQELCALLPEQYGLSPGSAASSAAAGNKPNKGSILGRSVDYIRHLEKLVEQQNQRIQQLENGQMQQRHN